MAKGCRASGGRVGRGGEAGVPLGGGSEVRASWGGRVAEESVEARAEPVARPRSAKAPLAARKKRAERDRQRRRRRGVKGDVAMRVETVVWARTRMQDEGGGAPERAGREKERRRDATGGVTGSG